MGGPANMPRLPRFRLLFVSAVVCMSSASTLHHGSLAFTQEFGLPEAALKDDAALARAMPDFARTVIALYREDDRERYLDTLFRLQIIAGQYSEALTTLKSLRAVLKQSRSLYPDAANLQYQIYSTAKLQQQDANLSFPDAFRQAFRDTFKTLDDK